MNLTKELKELRSWTIKAVTVWLFIGIILLGWAGLSHAEISEDVAVSCILGEVRGEYSKYGYNSFLALASALRNRNSTQGVYGCTADYHKEINFLVKNGYYNKALQAWKESEFNDIVNGAQYWESTDFKKPSWAYSMTKTVRVGKTVYYRKSK